jgi:hypothetical protein
MGRYAQVRGWIEASDEVIPAVAAVISAAPATHASLPEQAEAIALYQGGWHIGPVINWTRYVFFGADVTSNYVDAYLSIVTALAQLQDEDGEYPVGLFYVDVEDGPSMSWRVADGQVMETPRDEA